MERVFWMDLVRIGGVESIVTVDTQAAVNRRGLVPTHKMQRDVRKLDASRALVYVPSVSSSKTYTVQVDRDSNGCWTATKCNCMHGQHRGRKPPKCYHQRVALDVLDERQDMSSEFLQGIACALEQVWSSAELLELLREKARLHQDRYSAVMEVHKELKLRGEFSAELLELYG